MRTLPPKRDETILANGVRHGAVNVDLEDDVRSGVEDDEEVTNALGGKVSAEALSTEGKQIVGVSRAPHFPLERKPHWWIYLGDAKQDRIIVQPSKLTDVGPDKTRSFTIQFQAPPNAGMYTFVAQIKSDSYLGSDAQRFVKLRVEDSDVLDGAEGEYEDEEDDISEPDEDTLAGQMAMMRGGKVKPSPVHRRRSESDDEDDDEDAESGTDEEVDEDEVTDSDTDEE